MDKFDTRRVAEGLTAYAIERQYGVERHQRQGDPNWMEQRHFWTDAILQGMARLNGGQPDQTLMERFDHELERAQSGCFFTPATHQMQKDTVRELRRFVSALEATGDDRRRQVDVVWRLLEDMSLHLPWASKNNDLSLACGEAESTLRRMTAQMPIRFTRILLGGDAGPHWASGFASGSVTDAEAVKQTAIYREAVRDYPEVKSWPALCTVYVGRDLPSALGTVDASAFDLEIMNRAGDCFVNDRGVRWVSGAYQMTIPVDPAAAKLEKTRAEESHDEELNPLLQGSRPLAPNDLAGFERYAEEKLDEFYVELYGKHLPGMPSPRQEDIDPPRLEHTL